MPCCVGPVYYVPKGVGMNMYALLRGNQCKI